MSRKRCLPPLESSAEPILRYLQTSENRRGHCTGWPLHPDLGLPHGANDSSKPPPHSLIFSFTPSPDLSVTPSCYLPGIYQVCPSKNLLRKGMFARQSRDPFPPQGFLPRVWAPSGTHQHIPGTFSSGHPQERNKERTSIHSAWRSLQPALKANLTEEQPIGAGKGRAEGQTPACLPHFFCLPVGRWSCILSDGSPYARCSLG